MRRRAVRDIGRSPAASAMQERGLTPAAGAVYDPRAMRGLARVVRAVPPVVVTALMLLAIANMLAGVFLRYVMTKVSATFDLPSIRFFWVEEVGELCLAWMTFIGAAIGIQRGIHFSVQLVTDRLPHGVRQTIFTVHYTLIAGFGLLVSIYGWRVAEGNSLSASPALGLNLRWLYLSAVVGGVLIALYSLATIAEGWRGRWPGHETPEVE